ncbi:ATP-binding protein [Chloroflexi bacterium TSY]|nr:ATP-binding protein [Chloroflexi bacterium TSY]
MKKRDSIMLKKLPIGIQTFEKIRVEDFLYVDKTEQIHRLITLGDYFFLSRPRRSGKSLTLSTIKSIYLGQRELFSDLWIEDQWDWDRMNPVIHISFSGIGYQTQGLEAAIEAELRLIAEQLTIPLTQTGIDRLFAELIRKLSDKGKVVLLIDEYDKPIIDYLDNTEQAITHRTILKTFYSVIKDSDPHIEFLLITGVSKFSKVSIFSDLNNLTDITLNRRFATLTGYTQEEVEQDFVPHIVEVSSALGINQNELIDQLRHWYNGYSWDGSTYVYNPFSVLSFFQEAEFRNFWFETGTPSFLLILMRKEWLYALENLTVTERTLSSYDIENLQAIPILFQTGYLTIKEKGKFGLYTLDYPNAEVKESLLDYMISDLRHDHATLATPMVVQLYEAFHANDMERLITLIKSIFKNIPSQIFIRAAEAYYHSLIYLVFFYLGQYTESEVNTNDGRLDCIVKTPTHIYILEFKLDKSADEALQQIRDKGYADKYAADPRPKVLLAINFSSENKTVDGWKRFLPVFTLMNTR